MKLEPISGIYLIEDLKTGRVYVGQSTNCYARMAQHTTNTKWLKTTNKGLQEVVDERGYADLHFEIVEQCDSAQLRSREAAWMKKFRSEDLLNTQKPTWRAPKPLKVRGDVSSKGVPKKPNLSP